MSFLKRVALASVILSVSGAALAVSSTTETVVRVDCARRGSINAALRKHRDAATLVIRIRGMCTENVQIERSDVTLLGEDPAADGVRAPEGTDYAVRVRASRGVILQNLRLTGGDSGGVAIFHSNVRLTHCRAEENLVGAEVSWSFYLFEDSSFSFNSLAGLTIYGSSFGRCTRCAIADNLGGAFSEGIEIGDGSFLNLFESHISGSDIGIVAANSRVIVRPGSTLSASRVAITSFTGASVNVNLQGAAFEGSVDVQGGTLFLNATQTLNPNPDGNILSSNAHFSLRPGASVMGLQVAGFSSAVVGVGSTINGDLTCGSGGDAFCSNPASVTGASTCGKCLKP